MTKRNRGKERFHQAAILGPASDSSGESDADDVEKIASILDNYATELLGDTEDIKNNKSFTRKVESKRSFGQLDFDSDKGLKKKKREVEVVVFHSEKPKKFVEKGKPGKKSEKIWKTTDIGNDTNFIESKFSNERLNSAEVLKKLQFDVGSFGMKAFSKEVQREQEKKRAIKLGAKPPKRKYLNYKELMEAKKKLKMEADADSSRDASGEKNSMKSKSSHGQPKFWKEGNKSYIPQIGKYRNGVLKLSSKDIKSVSKRR